MSPRGPGAVALTLGFTSLRSHPVPSLPWGCQNTMKYFFLASFSAPWCHLSDGCHLTHDYGMHVARRVCYRPGPVLKQSKPHEIIHIKSLEITPQNNLKPQQNYTRLQNYAKVARNRTKSHTITHEITQNINKSYKITKHVLSSYYPEIVSKLLKTNRTKSHYHMKSHTI